MYEGLSGATAPEDLAAGARPRCRSLIQEDYLVNAIAIAMASSRTATAIEPISHLLEPRAGVPP